MIRTLKTRITFLLILAITSVVGLTSSVTYSNTGTVPFGFFKNSAGGFQSVGGYLSASAGFVTGEEFGSGSTDGMFKGVSGVAIDSANDFIFVIESLNVRVSKYKLSTGKFIGSIGNVVSSTGSCVAGAAATGWCTGGVFGAGTADGMFTSPTGIAFDPATSSLFISDFIPDRISKFNSSTGAFVGAIGALSGASTGTCAAAGVASGWCTGGAFALGAGDGAFNNPAGIAFDSTNDALYIADQGNHRVTKVTASTGAYVGSIGKLNAGSSGTCASSGVAAGWCTGGVFSNGTSDGQFSAPSKVTYDPDNDALYLPGSNRIVKITATTGAFVGAFGYAGATSGTCVSGTASGWCSGGTIFVSIAGVDGSIGSISQLRYDPLTTSIYFTEAGKISKITAAGAFAGSIGQTTASSGTCPATGAATGWCTGGTFATGSEDGMFSFVGGIEVNPLTGFLYASDSNNGRLHKITASTGAYNGAIGGIVKIAPGWRSYLKGAPSKKEGAHTPFSIALDSANQILYVADRGSDRVVKMNATTGAFIGAIGNVTSSTGTCPASGAAPGWCTGGKFASGSEDGMFKSFWGIEFDAANDALYIADTGNFRIVKVTASTGAFVGAIGKTTFVGGGGTCTVGFVAGWCTKGTFATASTDGGFASPRHASYDSVNNALYITDYSNQRLIKVTATTGAFVGVIGKVNTVPSGGTCVAGTVASGWCTGGTFVAGSVDGAFFSPRIALPNAAGTHIYVVDVNLSRISKFTSAGVFVGAIGNTTANIGTCPASGATSGWCTGGTFAAGTGDGMFDSPLTMTYDSTTDALYISNIAASGTVSKVTASTGLFVGSIGKVTASTGTCKVGISTKWCTGGTFDDGDVDGAFNGVYGIAYDAAKNIFYFAENGNYRIQRWKPAN